MLFQVGGQGARPTFFEMSAAQQLPASLRAALSYSLGVFALRRPFLHKVLDYEDEFFALLMSVLESHSLRTTAWRPGKNDNNKGSMTHISEKEISYNSVIDVSIALYSALHDHLKSYSSFAPMIQTKNAAAANGSFSESLYGLRRRPVKVSVNRSSPGAESNDKAYDSALRKRQKTLSVIFLVVLPYFKSKLQSIYNKEREARLQASLWDQGEVELDEAGFVSDQQRATSQAQAETTTGEVSHMTRLKTNFTALIGVCYPWIHATNEGLSFAYQLLYLLDATAFYSPGLHVLGLHVCRATGQELMDSSSRISRIRSRELERLRGPPWLKTMQRVILNCMYTSLDYAQTGLIAAVFFFKMMEWWYQSAEERMSAPTVYPPPPPPPLPKVAKDGLPLPPDRTLCPLCCQKRNNPSVLSVSGFVFCYSCIFKSVSQHKRCPVTLMPASVEQIRRLFHDL